MHQTRSETIKQLPLARKGTKYIAYASRNNSNAVPLVVAIRDMLKLANTSKEVKGMIHNKIIKINGKNAKSLNDPICLFSILNLDKNYILTILPTGRFAFEETKETSRRLKIIRKTAVKNNAIQYTLHDGTSLLADKKFSVGDTIIVNFENKLVKHIGFEKGKDVFVFSGSNIGKMGKIKEIDENKVAVKFDKEEAMLEKAQLIAI